jgi:primosomal protein N' (replication factor Y)
MLPYSAQRKTFARHLRRAQTDAEGKLWLHLRNRRLYGVKFRRQHPIGKYIADFCSVESELIIELDGGQHMERTKEDGQRSRFFEHKGFRVLRFWNNEVLLNTEAVVEQIARFIGDRRTCLLPRRAKGGAGRLRK